MAQEWTPTSALAKTVYAAGFSYDPNQDILVSRLDAPQRHFGYAPLYDKLAPVTISAVIDCEPIYFQYADKDWMIELWKGQYGFESGAEIGVYNRPTAPTPSEKLRYEILDHLLGRYFGCAGPQDQLIMSLELTRKGARLFSREPTSHWWLTGFQWGVFSTPQDLVARYSVSLKDEVMCVAFVKALSGLGYDDVTVEENTVGFTYDRPHTKQQRSGAMTARVLAVDEELVGKYNELKAALGLKSNDPNLIQDALIEKAGALGSEVYDDLVKILKSFGENWVSQAAELHAEQLHVPEADRAP